MRFIHSNKQYIERTMYLIGRYKGSDSFTPSFIKANLRLESNGLDSVSNHNATVNNVVFENSSARFNGNNSTAIIEDSDDLSFYQLDQSFSIHFKLKILANGNIFFVSKRDGNNQLFEYEILYYQNVLIFYLCDSNTQGSISISLPFNFNINEEYSISCTYNGNGSSSGMCIYVNKIIRIVSYSDSNFSKMYNTTNKLYLGYAPWATFTLNGYLKDFRLYSGVLTQSEIDIL